MIKQNIASSVSGTYKAVNSSLVYTKAEGCSLLAREFSGKSTRNKPAKSDFHACKLSDFIENPRPLSMLLDTRKVTISEFNACLFLERCVTIFKNDLNGFCYENR